MAKDRKLDELATARGQSVERFVDWVLVPFVNRHGQAAAALEFGTTQKTVSKWLKEFHYVNRPMWMKDTTPQEKKDIEAAAQRANARRITDGRPTLEEEA